MKRSTKLPVFSGYCRAGKLANTARYEAARAVLLAGRARAQCSRRADGLLPLLGLLLLLAGLTRCAPARTATEAHATHAEHPAPARPAATL